MINSNAVGCSYTIVVICVRTSKARTTTPDTVDFTCVDAMAISCSNISFTSVYNS